MRRFLISILLLCTTLTGIAQTAKTNVYGPTDKNEQLWQIAILVRPTAHVSIQQMMLALYNSNHDAFSSDNINSLKANVTLNIPTLETIKQTSLQDASNIIALIMNRKLLLMPY